MLLALFFCDQINVYSDNGKLIQGYDYATGKGFDWLPEIKKIVKINQKSIEKNPDNIGAYIILGSLYGAHGKYEESINYYQQALKIDPENVLALQGLGGTYLLMAHFQEKSEFGDKGMKILKKTVRICIDNDLGCEKGSQELIDKYIKTRSNN